MNIHEYQAKKLLSDFGVPVPKDFRHFPWKKQLKMLKI